MIGEGEEVTLTGYLDFIWNKERPRNIFFNRVVGIVWPDVPS
jgi:hypothetical protein